jgi:hypothetical protein
VPPLDVAWVWHVHRLKPSAYDVYCRQVFGEQVHVDSAGQAFSFSDGSGECGGARTAASTKKVGPIWQAGMPCCETMQPAVAIVASLLVHAGAGRAATQAWMRQSGEVFNPLRSRALPEYCSWLKESLAPELKRHGGFLYQVRRHYVIGGRTLVCVAPTRAARQKSPRSLRTNAGAARTVPGRRLPGTGAAALPAVHAAVDSRRAGRRAAGPHRGRLPHVADAHQHQRRLQAGLLCRHRPAVRADGPGSRGVVRSSALPLAWSVGNARKRWMS